MSKSRHLKRILPPVVVALLLGLANLRSAWLETLAGGFCTGDGCGRMLQAMFYFAIAWLAGRLVVAALEKVSSRRRPVPRLMGEMVSFLFFTVAAVASVAAFVGGSVSSALAGSGILIALLGFAIRNVVADTLSGVAIGLEAPFRIGDWIDIDGIVRGQVIEIGWRTTRLLTRDSAYMILPNSQIARQRMTNYSAPRKHYRSQVEVVLSHDLPISEARRILLGAVATARLVMQDPAPDVRVVAYDGEGIRYAVRYWVPRFDRDLDCRDEIYARVDEALRANAVPTPSRRVELVGRSGLALPAGQDPDTAPAADRAGGA